MIFQLLFANYIFAGYVEDKHDTITYGFHFWKGFQPHGFTPFCCSSADNHWPQLLLQWLNFLYTHEKLGSVMDWKHTNKINTLNIILSILLVS